MADENEVVDFDSMSDEDFLNAIEEAGSARPEDEENVSSNEDAGDIEDTNHTEETDEEYDEEAETNDLSDDEDQDTDDSADDSEDEADEGNAQKDNSETDESDDDKSGDEADTKDDPDGENQDTEEIDYKKQYKQILEENQKLKDFEKFYNEVTSEFVANGKKVKGFTDPQKIIKSQQMAAGFSDKMASFSKYKPFMNAIKDHGFLENPDKFNLAINLIEGDKEAIKKHIKDLNIDPFEFDMENIDYKGKNQIASNIEIAYEEVLETAKANNIDREVQDVITKEWDDQSVIELLEDPQSSADLIEHIKTGAYDLVQDKILDKKRIDVNGVYSRKPMIEQYREAAREVELEIIQAMQNQQQQAPSFDEESIQAEMQKIEEERSTQEYREKVEKQKAKVNEARKKATSLSKKKPRTRAKKRVVFDPTSASDEEFTKYLDSIMYAQ
jgi:hypothetical protein